jgi:tRNA pseudouridine55 synthase
MDGVLLVDKPSGPTSFDVVRMVRRASGARRAGHAGTLDPLATGLLVVCVGTHTRLVPYLVAGSKRYEATVALGAATDTDDADGEVVSRSPVPPLTRETVEAAAARFVGAIAQRPPAYCALKIGGRAAHRLARRGEEVELAARTVVIHAIDVRELRDGEIRLDILCGAGTYVRALARDLAVALGTVGHVAALRRTAASGFDVAEAVPADAIEALAARGDLGARLHVGADALRGMPRLTLSEEDALSISCGRSIPLSRNPPDPLLRRGISQSSPFEKGGQGDFRHAALIAPDGALLAIARVEGDLLRPERGFPR